MLAITGSQQSLKARSLRLALMWIFIACYLGRHLVVIPFDLAVVQNEQVIHNFRYIKLQYNVEHFSNST